MWTAGINQSLGEFTSDELSGITYRLSTQTIARLSEALELCAQLGMGVMLDIKATDPSDAFLDSAAESLLKNGLETCTLTLNTSQRVVKKFKDVVVYPLRREEYDQVFTGKADGLGARYYFEWGARIEEETLRLMHESGVFVIAAINFFHYPRHARGPLAKQDIERLLEAGVDGFQIDDEFRGLVPGLGK